MSATLHVKALKQLLGTKCEHAMTKLKDVPSPPISSVLSAFHALLC